MSSSTRSRAGKPVHHSMVSGCRLLPGCLLCVQGSGAMLTWLHAYRVTTQWRSCVTFGCATCLALGTTFARI